MRALSLLALLGFTQGIHARTNPLATRDQLALDALAADLYKSTDFSIPRSAARAQYLLTLKKYGKTIDPQTEDDIDVAIDELVFSALQKAVNNDPAHPKVYWTDAPPRDAAHWFGIDVPGGRYSYDNTGCIYRTIPISSKYEYVVRGKRTGKGPSDVTYSLISNPNSQGTVASIVGDELVVEEDGTFEITISKKKKEDVGSKNHIKSDFRAVQLFVRHNLGDWATETVDELSVEILSDVSDVEPATNETIIKQTKRNINEGSFFYGFGALDFKTLVNPLNQLDKPSQSAILGTLTTQASSFGHFNLAPDEALIVTLSAGISTYWVLPAYTLGMITHAPWENVVSFNNKQAKQNTNGTYTFVVSQRDSGVYNWVNTTGRTQGTFMGRWQGLPRDTKVDNEIEVWSYVVPLEGVKEVVPEETVWVDQWEREEIRRERLEGWRRVHWGEY